MSHRSYELSNHLGNVLAVITDNAGMKPDSVWATVSSTSDYYPFGLEMKSRSYNDTTSAYRYGFNGKEKDNFNATVYDYGFRIYNPEIAKFLSVDPLTKEYAMLTPYQYASNTPVQAIDLDGLEAFPVHGTWGNNGAWSKDEGPNELTTRLMDIFGNNTLRLKGQTGFLGSSWSGGNQDKYRRAAAAEMITYIKENRVPGEPVTIIGHSHGGNVGVLVMNELAEDPEFADTELNLLTMNTPSRGDYQLSETALARVNHYHIFNRVDPIQILGGDLVKNFLFRDGDKKIDKLPTGELGIAKRKFSSATNIRYKSKLRTLEGNHQSWQPENINTWLDKVKEAVKTRKKSSEEKEP